MTKFIDLKCPKCGFVLEDVVMEEFIKNKKGYKCQNGHAPVDMVKMIPASRFRMINYSVEYRGGSDKNLDDQPEELLRRKK